MSDDPDIEYAMIDAMIIKRHQHRIGEKGGLKARPEASRKGDGQPNFWLSWMLVATSCASS